jgi:hypothetical protein
LNFAQGKPACGPARSVQLFAGEGARATLVQSFPKHSLQGTAAILSNPMVDDLGHLNGERASRNIKLDLCAGGGIGMKKWKLDRIISIATLVTSVVALVLVLKRPTPVATPQTPAQAAANAQSFQEKMAQFDLVAPAQPQAVEQQDAQLPSQSTAGGSQESQFSVPSSQPKSSPGQVHITSNEITAALAQASGSIPAAAGQLAPGSDLGSMPNILDQQVSFDGDQAHGQFLLNIAGKDVWVTVSGHLGSKDGYATFEPTEFKVGDLNVPVSLVNDALQKRLAEQHDRMKLPDNVGGIKVEHGELVLTQK